MLLPFPVHREGPFHHIARNRKKSRLPSSRPAQTDYYRAVIVNAACALAARLFLLLFCRNNAMCWPRLSDA